MRLVKAFEIAKTVLPEVIVESCSIKLVVVCLIQVTVSLESIHHTILSPWSMTRIQIAFSLILESLEIICILAATDTIVYRLDPEVVVKFSGVCIISINLIISENRAHEESSFITSRLSVW